MDWSRAKTILIIAYVVLDLVLAWHLFTDPARSRVMTRQLSAGEARRVEEEAASHGIEVRCAVPRDAAPMPMLTVRKAQTDPDAIALSLLREAGPTASRHEEHGKIVYDVGGQRVTVYENGVTVYERLSGQAARPAPQIPAGEEGRRGSAPDGFDEKAAVSLARKFWGERSGLPQDARFDSAVWNGRYGAFAVNFYQEYRRTPLFAGRRFALVGSEGVIMAMMSWFEVVAPGRQPVSTLTVADAIKALYPLAEQREAAGEKIVVRDMRLGYYTEAYNARQWEAVPAWRFQLQDGTNLYVNAYTGHLEGGGFTGSER